MEKFSFNGIDVTSKVKRVIDGDTVIVTLPITLQIGGNICRNGDYEFSIRLYGINTCELKGPEREKALCAKDRLQQLIDECNGEVFIKCKQYDKYGRILGELFSSEKSEKSFNQILLDEGLAGAF
jgi:endonuclease YncB( thermonuclease family)